MSSTELGTYLAVTRRLPPVPGMAKITDFVRKVYLRKPRGVVESNLFGSRVELDPNDWLEGQFLFNPQTFERREVDFVREFLRPGDTFLDCGCHLGFFSMAAAAAVGKAGRVLAIDANPTMAAKFTKTIAANDLSQVQLVHCGLSDREEELELQVHQHNSGATSFLNVSRGKDVVQVAKIPCRPLLAVLAEAGVETIRVAKMDIEGMEYRVLKCFLADAPDSLRPEFILTEHYQGWVEHAGGDAMALLESNGYEIIWSARRGASRVLRRTR